MIELLVKFVIEHILPLISVDRLEKIEKKKSYKSIVRFIIDLSLLSENLGLFCKELEQWKQNIKSYELGFFGEDTIPRLNSFSIGEIYERVMDIQEDRYMVYKWIKYSFFGAPFENELDRYIEYKRQIFSIWGAILSENRKSVCAREKSHIAIPSYSILLTDMSMFDFAYAANDLRHICHVFPYARFQNEKVVFKKEYRYFRNNDLITNDLKIDISCIKYVGIDEIEPEIDSIIQATRSAKQELDIKILELKKSFEAIMGDDKSDIFLYL